MNQLSQREVALATFDECLKILPSILQEAIYSPATDPRAIKKGDTDILSLRIFPKHKSPIRFWSSQWCFYEIGVGHYEAHTGEGLNLGGISFVQFPFNERCGKGAYQSATLEILRRLQGEKPSEFSLTEARHDKQATIFQRRYFITTHKTFPISVAANDLAWLIQKSLPQFQALGA